jgi:Thioesterase-like superfamily
MSWPAVAMNPPAAAFIPLGEGRFASTQLARGPWNPAHQHAGPPIALVAGCIEAVARQRGFGFVTRLTANLLRPVPLAELRVQVTEDYVGKSAGHFAATLHDGDKLLARFSALARAQTPQTLPPGLPGHGVDAPRMPRMPQDSTPAQFPFADGQPGYAELVEIREARGKNFQGPCAVWFRLRHPLVQGETPSPMQRVAVAADSGNGISAILDYRGGDVFVNFDLNIHLGRQPQGEWIGLDARTLLGGDGGGLAESALFDESGWLGRATQSLSVKLAH